jgi:hypothetical protein
MYAERAYSHKVEAEGASHAVYISHAKEVAALIEDESRTSQCRRLSLVHLLFNTGPNYVLT